MEILLAILAGGWLFGGSSKTVVVNMPKEEKLKRAETGKCNACPEISLFREDYGFYACDFCYDMYKKYNPISPMKYNPTIHYNHNF